MFIPAHVDLFVAVSKNDLELFVELKAGSASALETLYDLYGDVMCALAFRILKNRQEAEDLVQEIFLSVWRNCTYQPERGSLKTFLMMLTRFKAIDRLRSQSARSQSFQRAKPLIDKAVYDAVPFAAAVSDEVSQRVRAALQALPEQQRQALEMSYFEGMTQLEISQSLNVPLGTVKSWFRLGFRKLRHSLKDLIDPTHNV